MKTVYHLCQLAPRVCAPEGKGRVCCCLATTTKRPSVTVLTTQSRTHIGQECLRYPIFFSHHITISDHVLSLVLYYQSLCTRTTYRSATQTACQTDCSLSSRQASAPSHATLFQLLTRCSHPLFYRPLTLLVVPSHSTCARSVWPDRLPHPVALSHISSKIIQ